MYSKSYHCDVDVFDPKADKREALEEYNIELVDKPAIGKYEAIVFAVAHDEFKQLSVEQIKELGKSNHVLYDVKCLLKAHDVDGRL